MTSQHSETVHWNLIIQNHPRRCLCNMFCEKVFSYRCILDNINMDSGISLMRQTESDLLVVCATWCYYAVETFLAHLFRKHSVDSESTFDLIRYRFLRETPTSRMRKCILSPLLFVGINMTPHSSFFFFFFWHVWKEANGTGRIRLAPFWENNLSCPLGRFCNNEVKESSLK